MLFGCGGFRKSLTAHPNPSRKREGREEIREKIQIDLAERSLAMKHLALEKELTAKIRKRRLIECGVTAGLFAFAILFAVLYENSKVYEESFLGDLATDSNIVLYWFMAAAIFAIFLFVDFSHSNFRTVEYHGGYITFYRGMFKCYLYFNGELKGSSAGYYLEANITAGTKVTVAIGRWSAHMTFSNGHRPIYF